MTTVLTQIRKMVQSMSYEIIVLVNFIQIISQSKQNALKKINEELIHMYWKVRQFLGVDSTKAAIEDAFMDLIAEEIQSAFPGIKGFNRRGLYYMKKFYVSYKDDEIVSTLLSQISWSCGFGIN